MLPTKVELHGIMINHRGDTYEEVSVSLARGHKVSFNRSGCSNSNLEFPNAFDIRLREVASGKKYNPIIMRLRFSPIFISRLKFIADCQIAFSAYLFLKEERTRFPVNFARFLGNCVGSER